MKEKGKCRSENKQQLFTNELRQLGVHCYWVSLRFPSPDCCHDKHFVLKNYSPRLESLTTVLRTHNISAMAFYHPHDFGGIPSVVNPVVNPWHNYYQRALCFAVKDKSDWRIWKCSAWICLCYCYGKSLHQVGVGHTNILNYSGRQQITRLWPVKKKFHLPNPAL